MGAGLALAIAAGPVFGQIEATGPEADLGADLGSEVAGESEAPTAQAAPATLDDPFNIPGNVTMLGTGDPNRRQATARVNGTIVTGTDIDQRVALIVSASGEGAISPDEEQRLRVQVLRNLIDETLQIQEAAAQDMAVSSEEVDATYNRLAAERFNRTLDEMEVYLRSVGSSPASLKRQIQGELAWDRLLRRNVAPFVDVSAGEVNELIERLQASRGTSEYRIGEIFLAATSTDREAVRQNASQIVDQLRQGGSFVAYARQYSQASTAAVGGDLGWIRLEQLQNDQLEQVAGELTPGQLAGPIEIPGGFSILFLIDQRQVGMADPRDALVSLKQISLDFPQGLSEQAATERAESFAAAVQQIRGCGDAESAAAAMGAEVVSNDGIAVRALPDALQPILLELNLGQSTPPFGSLDEGVRVLMLCGRDDPQGDGGPNFDDLMAQIEDDRVNRRAQRYLRDLRRDAVIEYN